MLREELHNWQPYFSCKSHIKAAAMQCGIADEFLAQYCPSLTPLRHLVQRHQASCANISFPICRWATPQQCWALWGRPSRWRPTLWRAGPARITLTSKRLAFGQPEVLHALLAKLAENVADYVRYQVHPAVLMCLTIKLTWSRKARFDGPILRLG